MRLHTTSEVISLAKSFENEAAGFYEKVSQLCPQEAAEKEIMLDFARDNRKNIKHIERTYYGVISDAIEGCFAFDLEADKYTLDTVADGSYAAAIGKLVIMEETLIKFYTDAAEQSGSLMADIPAAFSMISQKRGARIPKLKSILEVNNRDKG